ncbi:MAG TPA: hypothetical protein PLJ21_06240 [Pseudobdellovibrionaceae bacterium]|nr:hypothetical protein [Pseudobdellovibrionaceae bacterium]
MNELIKLEEEKKNKENIKHNTAKKRNSNQDEDQFRVVINKDSKIVLDELVLKANDGFEGGEISKSDLVNLLIFNHRNSFSDADIKNLRNLHFDEKKVLKALLKKAGEDGDLPNEIKRVLREHLGLIETNKKKISKTQTELSTDRLVDN